MKSIIDHRNQRRSSIDNRFSAIIATSLLMKFVLFQVPCSRADVFSSKDISMLDKRMLMKFVLFQVPCS